jgi:lipopolysaccharide export system permease protein
MKIIDRYLLRELSASFGLGILLLTLLMLAHQVLRRIDFLLDLDLTRIGTLLIYLLPTFLLFTLPMAALFASVLTFNRLTIDREIGALQAAGIFWTRLAMPLALFSLCATLLTFWMAALQPEDTRSFKSLASDLIKQGGLGLEPGRFIENHGRVVYVESMPTPTDLKGVFVYDREAGGDATLIVAASGQIVHKPESDFVALRLSNGNVYRREQGTPDPPAEKPLVTWKTQRLIFGTYEFRLPFPRSIDLSPPPGHPQATASKNVSLALATALFGLSGLPLGIWAGRSGRLAGFVASLGLIVLYYLLVLVGDAVTGRGWIGPVASAFIPHGVLIPISLSLFYSLRGFLKID